MAKAKLKKKKSSGYEQIFPETLAGQVITATGNAQTDITNMMQRITNLENFSAGYDYVVARSESTANQSIRDTFFRFGKIAFYTTTHYYTPAIGASSGDVPLISYPTGFKPHAAFIGTTHCVQNWGQGDVSTLKLNATNITLYGQAAGSPITAIRGTVMYITE